MSALPIGLMTLSSAIKLTHAPDFAAAWTQKLGWPEGTLTSIGLLELACVALYAVPQTTVLGAILLTGYLGGAIASHVRIGDPFLVPLVLGVLAWAASTCATGGSDRSSRGGARPQLLERHVAGA